MKPFEPRAHLALAVAGMTLATVGSGPLLGQPNGAPAQTAAPVGEVSQADLVRQLLSRIEQLEKREAERTEAARRAPGEEATRFQNRIRELEGKVGALEAARLPSEIHPPGDAPTGPTLRELDQRLKITEQKREVAETSAAAAEAKARTAPRMSLSQNGFVFSSADTNFVLKIGGQIQLDSRTFINDNPLSRGNDGFSLRRVRPTIEGTLYGNTDFQFVPEFGGTGPTLYDAYLNYRVDPTFQIRAGKFKGPVGLEQLQADTTLPFNERSLATDLVPLRNVGVEMWGKVADDLVSYAAGVFNVSGDGRNPNNTDFNDDREYAGRLFVKPFRQTGVAALQGFGFGLGGSYSEVRDNALGLPSTTGGTLPGYTTPGLQQFFAYDPKAGVVTADGPQWRISPQATYLYGPFGLLGEYVISHQGVKNATASRAADLEHRAWQVSGQWVLTGEPASFTGIDPQRPFSLRSGGLGAWQLVGRYGRLDIDDKTFPDFSNPANSATAATSWSVGVNWWLNKNVRVLTGFTHTSFKGGASAGAAPNPDAPALVTAQDENAVSTRVQISF